MEKYKPYPKYKDSGVDWLGEIPARWGSIPVGRLYKRIKRVNQQNEELLSVYRDFGVVPKSSRDDNFNKPSEDLSAYQLVRCNDLVMNKMKAWQGSIAISSYQGIVSPAYFVYEPLLKAYDYIYSKYVHYLLRSPIYIAQYLRRSKGIRVNQWDLDPDEFQCVDLCLPCISEQTQIANFLDYETTKIDRLIEKQERLIELLQEKRQAVISHAVTKGLNPDAPMKDSGVEWLGEVPAHWTVTKAKFVSSIFVPQRNKPELNEDAQGVPWVTMENMKSDYVTKGLYSVASEAMLCAGSKILPKSSVIASCVGNFGVASINNEEVVINQQLQAFVPAKINAEYLRDLVSLSETYFDRIGTAATLVYVNQQGFEELPVLLPSTQEQDEISMFVSERKKGFSKLFEGLQKQISLLQERRAVLISAAVTGKIDLSNF